MAKFKYKATETSVDTKHFYIESEQELNNEDINNALCMASFNKYSKVKFKSEDTGAQGYISFEACEYGDDTNIEWTKENE